MLRDRTAFRKWRHVLPLPEVLRPLRMGNGGRRGPLDRTGTRGPNGRGVAKEISMCAQYIGLLLLCNMVVRENKDG